jgi:hypothetical protein
MSRMLEQARRSVDREPLDWEQGHYALVNAKLKMHLWTANGWGFYKLNDVPFHFLDQFRVQSVLRHWATRYAEERLKGGQSYEERLKSTLVDIKSKRELFR